MGPRDDIFKLQRRLFARAVGSPEAGVYLFYRERQTVALGNRQVFCEMASRVLGCGFDAALGQAVRNTSE